MSTKTNQENLLFLIKNVSILEKIQIDLRNRINTEYMELFAKQFQVICLFFAEKY